MKETTGADFKSATDSENKKLLLLCKWQATMYAKHWMKRMLYL